MVILLRLVLEQLLLQLMMVVMLLAVLVVMELRRLLVQLLRKLVGTCDRVAMLRLLPDVCLEIDMCDRVCVAG